MMPVLQSQHTASSSSSSSLARRDCSPPSVRLAPVSPDIGMPS
jgi:hypothetical protein